MKPRIEAMILTSFVADSLALGVHWIYNTNVIDRKVGRVENLLKPIVSSFHPMRDKGEFTHYGDQMLLLLESVVACQSFDAEDFGSRWFKFLANYDGYRDKASLATLENLQAGKSGVAAASQSSDISAAARIAPLFCVYAANEDGLLTAAAQQAALTHNHPEVLEASRFFARVARRVLYGEAPVEALQATAQSGFSPKLVEGVENGLASAATPTRTAIGDLGQACATEMALPGVVHLIARYHDNLKEALIENVMAGGDSAARGMLAGLVLGAQEGLETVPAQWRSELKARARIETLVQQALAQSSAAEG